MGQAVRWAALVAAAALVLALGAAAGVLHSVAPRAGAAELASLVISSPPAAGSIRWKMDRGQRVNVLLFAYGGSGGDDPNFTDAMLVLSVRPHPLAATVLSLPRHLRVDIPAPNEGTISGLLYAAYSFGRANDARFLQARWLTPTGPGDLLAETVSQTIGQPIDGWAGIDEGAFAAVVDALGGVRVNVPQPLDDWQYPLDDTERTTHVHFDAGAQTLDGTRAVEYSRSRRSTSEVDRAARQELVLVAMLEALRDFHPGLSTLRALGPISAGMRTNLVPLDVRTLSEVATHLDPGGVKRVRLEDSGMLEVVAEGPIDTLVPVSGTYDDVRRYVASQLP